MHEQVIIFDEKWSKHEKQSLNSQPSSESTRERLQSYSEKGQSFLGVELKIYQELQICLQYFWPQERKTKQKIIFFTFFELILTQNRL